MTGRSDVLADLAEQRRATTREKLLRATLEVALERGLTGVTTHRVAAAAGFTTGAIYGNFRGRDDLLRSAMEFCRQHVPELEVTGAASLRDWAHEYVDAFFRLVTSPDELAQQIFQLQRQLSTLRETDETVRSVVDQWQEARFASIADRINDVVRRSDAALSVSAVTLAEQLVTLASWFSEMTEFCGDLMPSAVLHAGVDALIDNALAGRPSRRSRRPKA